MRKKPMSKFNHQLQAEIIYLKQEIKFLENKFSDYNSLLIENDIMKEQIKYEQENSLRGLREGRAGGIDKAVEIVQYWLDKRDRLPAYYVGLNDAKISLLATAQRIRAGEYEDPLTRVE